jgi:hypothetical protein
MTFLAALIVIAAFALGTYLIASDVHRSRRPPELRGDWWSRFEREFRAYAEAAERSARRQRRPERPT